MLRLWLNKEKQEGDEVQKNCQSASLRVHAYVYATPQASENIFLACALSFHEYSRVINSLSGKE